MEMDWHNAGGLVDDFESGLMLEASPFGSWKSPLSPSMMGGQSRDMDWLEGGKDGLYWTLRRPDQGGRQALMRWREGTVQEVLPERFNVRSRVHEYGGRPFGVGARGVWFVHAGSPGQPAGFYHHGGRGQARALLVSEAMTFMEPVERPGVWGSSRSVAVVAQTRPGVNTLEMITESGDRMAIATGADFYAAPSWSGDGQWLAWLEWNLPHMPWDQTALVVARIGAEGQLEDRRVLIDGAGRSVFQPGWSGERLFFIDDRSGYWQLYSMDMGTGVVDHHALDGECGLPMWQGGMRSYALGTEDVLVAHAVSGQWYVSAVSGGGSTAVPMSLAEIQTPCYFDGAYYVLGSGKSAPKALYRLNVETGESEALVGVGQSPLDVEDIALAQPVSWGGVESRAHGFYYPPCLRGHRGLEGELPPLLVFCHGGPTGQTFESYSPAVQFWTSRGFAVLDVNYRGSTGFGRAYRDSLLGAWGESDVADVVGGVEALVQEGLVDKARVVISGRSAGGFTVLSVLTKSLLFAAGCSRYGIADLRLLVQETHKFESGYLDALVGRWPEEEALYRSRSPLTHAGNIGCPVLFLQGNEDSVVPPNQAEAMAAALARRGVPFGYILFEGEGHGFRKSENIARAYAAELTFLGRILGFEPDCEDPELVIHRAPGQGKEKA